MFVVDLDASFETIVIDVDDACAFLKNLKKLLTLTTNFKRFGLQKCHGQNPFLMTLGWFLL
jgi:hypothetical protein